MKIKYIRRNILSFVFLLHLNTNDKNKITQITEIKITNETKIKYNIYFIYLFKYFRPVCHYVFGSVTICAR